MTTATEATAGAGWMFQRFQDDDNRYGLFLNYRRVMQAAKTDDQVQVMVANLFGCDDVGRIVWVDAPGPDAPWGVGECGEHRPEWLMPDWWTDASIWDAKRLTFAQRSRLLETVRTDTGFARQLFVALREAVVLESGGDGLWSRLDRVLFLEMLKADPKFAREIVLVLREVMKGGQDDA